MLSILGQPLFNLRELPGPLAKDPLLTWQLRVCTTEVISMINCTSQHILVHEVAGHGTGSLEPSPYFTHLRKLRYLIVQG